MEMISVKWAQYHSERQLRHVEVWIRELTEWRAGPSAGNSRVHQWEGLNSGADSRVAESGSRLWNLKWISQGWGESDRKVTQRCSAVCYFGFLGSFISPCSPQPQPARFRLCFHRSSWATPSFPSSGSSPKGAFTLPHTSHTRQAGVFCFDIYILHHKPDTASNYWIMYFFII